MFMVTLSGITAAEELVIVGAPKSFGHFYTISWIL